MAQWALAARAVTGPVVFSGHTQPYRRLNLLAYSPLCALLALGIRAIRPL